MNPTPGSGFRYEGWTRRTCRLFTYTTTSRECLRAPSKYAKTYGNALACMAAAWDNPTHPMPDLTRLLDAANSGDARAAEQLLPLVYDELRKLAARKLTTENPGQTLQATALVHEAYVRLVAGDADRQWNG